MIARLRGRPGYTNAYTEKVDRWVAEHHVRPSGQLIGRGTAVIDRILGDDSELRDLWEEAGDQEWRASVDDLRNRMAT